MNVWSVPIHELFRQGVRIDGKMKMFAAIFTLALLGSQGVSYGDKTPKRTIGPVNLRAITGTLVLVTYI